MAHKTAPAALSAPVTTSKGHPLPKTAGGMAYQQGFASAA
jgi:hypothetical protein